VTGSVLIGFDEEREQIILAMKLSPFFHAIESIKYVKYLPSLRNALGYFRMALNNEEGDDFGDLIILPSASKPSRRFINSMRVSAINMRPPLLDMLFNICLFVCSICSFDLSS
jgi:hypothetical protein